MMRPSWIDCVFLMKKHFLCVEQQTQLSCGKVKILMMLLNMNMNMIHQRSVCGVLWWKRYVSPPKNLVKCCTTLLLLCLCLSGQGVSDHRIGKGGPIPWHPHSSDFLFWRFVKDIAYCEKVHGVYELHDSHQLKSALLMKCLPISSEKTEYCLEGFCVTSGAHIEIDRAHKCCEVQCLKMSQFLQYTVWLKDKLCACMHVLIPFKARHPVYFKDLWFSFEIFFLYIQCGILTLW
jgi:hypothetical protein